MAEHNHHLSYHQLESILIGRLDPGSHPEIKAHLETCAECSGYLAKAPNTSAFLKVKYPTFHSIKESRADRKPAGYAAAIQDFLSSIYKPALAMLIFLVVGSGYFYWNSHREDTLSIKGGSPVFHVQVNGKTIFSGKDAIPVNTGDTLLISLTSSSPQYYYILYRDDNGKPMFYFPLAEEALSSAGTPQGEPLPHYIVLAPGWHTEDVFCIASPSPLLKEKAFSLAENYQSSKKSLQNGSTITIKHFILTNQNP